MAYGLTYDYAGDLTSVSSYGTTIQYNIDSAGRVNQVTSGWVDSQHPATLATVDPQNGYWPTGALRKLTLGNNLTESVVEDSLGQPCRINVNSSGTLLTNCADTLPSGNVQDTNANFNFGSSDNGNLAGLTASGQQNFNRSYTYDSLNRIQTMSAPGDACSALSWTIDPWGNRLAQTVTGGSCLSPSVSVDTGNHLTGAPYQYDAAGNLLKDGNHTYTYDAESRIATVDGGATATYVYDAEGNRVDKNVGGNDFEYLFDFGGHENTVFNNGSMQRMYVYVGGTQLAEYFANTTYFAHSDNLGSTRLLTGMDQSIAESDDYYPYGEPITAGTSDILKFTGKERDTESGLNDFGFRYYGSSLGRFFSPDDDSGQEASDPQSWNLYSYVENGPSNRIDPDGHDCIYTRNQTANSLTVDIVRGPCPGRGGTYVHGTVDVNSLTYNGHDLGFSSSDSDGENPVSNVLGLNAPPPPGQLSPDQIQILSQAGAMSYAGVKFVAIQMGTDALGIGFGRLAAEAADAMLAGRAAGTVATAEAAARVPLSEHAALQAADRGITQQMVDDAVKTAEEAGRISSGIGKYGTIQHTYQGTNGISVVVETEGRNAGKAITVFRTGSKP